MIWDTGYVAQPYYFSVPTGEATLVITSDGAMWYITSLSTGLNILRINNIATVYTLSGNNNDKVITVRLAGGDNVRLSRIRFKPRYN